MGVITYFAGNRFNSSTTWQAEFYGAQTSTHFEILDSNGVLRESNVGINFTYSGGFFRTGTITSTSFFGDSGQLTSQWNNLNVDVATRNSLLVIGASSYNFFQYVLRENDNILGSDSDDSILGSKGSDIINGGAGIDVLTFRNFINGAGQGITVNLATGQATTSFGNSVISNIEDIEGSGFNDVLTGNSGNNQIQGFAGADTINGGAGIDTVVYFDAGAAVSINLATGVVSGGSGADILQSIERVLGSRFNDVITGSNANESFLGGFGADTINGGGGIDTLEYNFIGQGVIVNLATGAASGGAGNDIISNIENINGSIFNDTLTGNAVANVIKGGNGNDLLSGGNGKDVLNGENGNDSLNGGNGADTLTGGNGADHFIYTAPIQTAIGLSNHDRIIDFSSAQGDKINIKAIDANSQLVGIQTWNFININFTGTAGQIRFDTANRLVLFDQNGDSASDFEIELTGVASMTSIDFIVI